jgi:hypothetical protein
MHHGYTQAEGVANLEGVPATGCLVDIGYPKFRAASAATPLRRDLPAQDQAGLSKISGKGRAACP